MTSSKYYEFLYNLSLIFLVLTKEYNKSKKVLKTNQQERRTKKYNFGEIVEIYDFIFYLSKTEKSFAEKQLLSKTCSDLFKSTKVNTVAIQQWDYCYTIKYINV